MCFYRLLCVAVLVLSGCAAPRYQTVYRYEPPVEAAGKPCLSGCEEGLAACQARCGTAFQTCMKEIVPLVEQRLAKAQEDYLTELEHYSWERHRYELYLWLNWHHGGLWYDPWPAPYFHPGPPPEPPSRDAIVAEARRERCVEDCGCLTAYDACFLTCGGRKIPEQQCVANCPRQ